MKESGRRYGDGTSLLPGRIGATAVLAAVRGPVQAGVGLESEEGAEGGVFAVGKDSVGD